MTTPRSIPPVPFTLYRHCGVVLARATTDPGGLTLPDLDLADSAALEAEGRAWLVKTWEHPQVKAAIRLASPVLADSLDRHTATVTAAAVRDLRRSIASLASYVQRWHGRCTPFGLFAGITAARIGPAAARIGESHRSVVRVDAEWLTDVIDRIERHPVLRPQLHVVADSTALIRDGRVVVMRRTPTGEREPGPLREASVRATRPVLLALAAARTPVLYGQVEAAVAAAYPATSGERIRSIVDGLIEQGSLITGLRAPMTEVDALPHLIRALREAIRPGETPPGLEDVTDLLARLERIHEEVQAHNSGNDGDAADRAVATMTSIQASTRPALAYDVRLDADLSIPPLILTEAQRAAGVLLRTGTRPFGSTTWLDYHDRFRKQYGPGALVPVTELVSEAGLGYPGGFLGSTRARPAHRILTERDVALMRLIQQAMLDDADEIALTDDDVAALTVGDPTTVVPPDRIEIGFALYAKSTAAIDRGDFHLRVTATPLVPSSMAGRFAYLLDDDVRDRLAETYADQSSDTVSVQVAFPPRRPHPENVTRIPAFLRRVVAVGDAPADAKSGTVIDLEDLAVTADAEQMYLVQVSTGRRVVPQVPHALTLSGHAGPLPRFIAQVATARSAVFTSFDLGAARTLTFVPRIRYRRTVLSPARWILEAADLHPVRGLPIPEWRRRWRVPTRIVAAAGGLRLPLDLDRALDRGLLEIQLRKLGRLELMEDGSADGLGWVGRPVEFLVPMHAADPTPRPLLATAPVGRVHRPGAGLVLHAQLIGSPARFDDILTGPLPAFLAELDGSVERWWVNRHRDMLRPESDQYVSVTVRLLDADAHGLVARAFADFAERLTEAGLPGRLSFASWHEPCGRYGTGTAWEAAEQVFATDTRAAIAQLRIARDSGIPAQALAAAGMVHLAAAFAPDPASGYQALIDRLPQGGRPVDRAVAAYVHQLAYPEDGYRAARSSPGGDELATAWLQRDEALSSYRLALTGQREAGTVLRSLLHEHHRRAVFVDPETEQGTGRLARAAAMRLLARGRQR